MDFFTGGSLIIDYWLKSVLMKNLFLSNMQLFTSQDINWWSGVDYVWIIVMFRSHSDGTHSHPLVSKWCKSTFLQIWWRNKLIYILDEPRVQPDLQQMLMFHWTIPFIFDLYQKANHNPKMKWRISCMCFSSGKGDEIRYRAQHVLISI